MISGLSCGFAGRGSGRLLSRRAPVLTVTDPCIWHGCGTNLSRRQSRTTAGAPAEQARVCLVAPPPASITLRVPSTRARTMADMCCWGLIPQIGKLGGAILRRKMENHPQPTLTRYRTAIRLTAR